MPNNCHIEQLKCFEGVESEWLVGFGITVVGLTKSKIFLFTESDYETPQSDWYQLSTSSRLSTFSGLSTSSRLSTSSGLSTSSWL